MPRSACLRCLVLTPTMYIWVRILAPVFSLIWFRSVIIIGHYGFLPVIDPGPSIVEAHIQSQTRNLKFKLNPFLSSRPELHEDLWLGN